MNRRPHAPQACALPGCATPRLSEGWTTIACGRRQAPRRRQAASSQTRCQYSCAPIEMQPSAQHAGHARDRGSRYAHEPARASATALGLFLCRHARPPLHERAHVDRPDHGRPAPETVGDPRPDRTWHLQQFRDPQSVSPGSIMPPGKLPSALQCPRKGFAVPTQLSPCSLPTSRRLPSRRSVQPDARFGAGVSAVCRWTRWRSARLRMRGAL